MKSRLAVDSGSWLTMASGLVLSSCGFISGSTLHCSDLAVDDQLRVTLRESIDSSMCDSVLGFVDGAELLLTVEDFGRPATCISAIGPATLEGVELDYWIEGSESGSGSGAFVSVSRNFGPCLGSVNLTVLRDDGPSETEQDTFDRMRITYQGPSDAGCPSYCDVPYFVDVERL